MFARKLVSLPTAQLPVQKTRATNSRVSISSKLIENKRLQVPHFGHLRKTGGRGSYQLCKGYPARPPRSSGHATRAAISLPLTSLP